jgi:hypothetical protein
MEPSWRHRFGLFLVGWLVAGVALLASLELLDPMLYFVIAAVGFFLAVEYSEPPDHRPQWHRRLRWVSLAILLVFANIVVRWTENITGISLL